MSDAIGRVHRHALGPDQVGRRDVRRLPPLLRHPLQRVLVVGRVAEALAEPRGGSGRGREVALLDAEPLLPRPCRHAVRGRERLVVGCLVLEAAEERLLDLDQEVGHGALGDAVEGRLDMVALQKGVQLVLGHARRVYGVQHAGVFLDAAFQPADAVQGAAKLLLERPDDRRQHLSHRVALLEVDHELLQKADDGGVQHRRQLDHPRSREQLGVDLDARQRLANLDQHVCDLGQELLAILGHLYSSNACCKLPNASFASAEQITYNQKELAAPDDGQEAKVPPSLGQHVEHTMVVVQDVDEPRDAAPVVAA